MRVAPFSRPEPRRSPPGRPIPGAVRSARCRSARCSRRRNAGRPAVQAVGGNGDLDGYRGPVTVRVETVQSARLLEDDRSGSVASRPTDVPGLRAGPGAGVAAAGVVGVEVVRPRTVGGEEDPGADPHRVPVGARVVGDLRHFARGAIEHVEVLRPAARVALPRPEVPKERRINELVSLRGPGARPGARHGERRWESASPRDFVERPSATPFPSRSERKRIFSPSGDQS